MEKIKELTEQRNALVVEMEKALVLLEQTKSITDKNTFAELEKKIEALDFQIASLEMEQVEIKPVVIEEIIKEKNKMEKDTNQLLRETIYGSDGDNTTNKTVLLPISVENKIIQKRAEGSIMRKYATVMKASGNSILPVQKGLATAAFGTEIAEIVENTPTFDSVEFRSVRCGSLVKVSQDAIRDAAFDLEAEIVSQISRAYTVVENTKFLLGSGTNEPKGLVLDATVGKAVVSATSAIAWTDVEDLFYSLPATYRKSAVWLMNSKTLKAVKALITDTAAQNVPLTEILGRPIEIAEDMQDSADGKAPIVFGDLAFYKILDRTGVEMKVLNELYAVNGIVGYLANASLDAKLTLPEAVVKMTMAAE